ncbi:hypothetical protein GCM10022220_10090 [Actinocatenispora rupis]|uniref:Orc1-like AAA ATPase domain-containing protein n=1 Tax=Actinocatenispora rupis TaxID=519421 RepID=A0A8J3J7W0_9ACTN|nr:hypothetical protein Aru02nite_08820 [Actinocatenispora rupis]
MFVGRGAALAALSAALGTAVADGPAVALVAGEAGIGKSRLLAEFARTTPTRVLRGTCTELGGDGLAYAPFVAVVRQLVRDDTVPPGRYRELGRWFPELGEPTGDGGRHRLYEEVLDLLERSAGPGPLVVAVEDLHWADAATRELFGFLARNLTRPGVLLLATYRPGVAETGPLLAELTRGPRTTTVRLDRLTEAEVGDQLAAILGAKPDPAAVRRVHARSDGNPLYVEALARRANVPRTACATCCCTVRARCRNRPARCSRRRRSRAVRSTTGCSPRWPTPTTRCCGCSSTAACWSPPATGTTSGTR